MAYDLDDAATQILLQFIRQTETGRPDPESYDVMYGHNRISPPFSQLSLKQAIAQGPSWTRAHRSSAAGAYQFMNATLKDLQRQLGLTGAEVLTPNVQDFLALTLLNRRGFQQFMDGQIGATEFGRRLAMEWASFPVLAPTRGQHRQVQRGQSYYAGDGLNKALVTPERMEAVLGQVKAAAGWRAPHPAPKPAPIPVETLPERKQAEVPAALQAVVVLAAVGAIFWFVFTQVL